MRIWEFKNYREYLNHRLGPQGSRTGLRKKLAAAIPVHTTFVSQVLNGKTDFSLEQAESINQFLDHNEDEGEYFILLLLKERAGSTQLKKRFEKKINLLRDQRLNIQKRLEKTQSLSQQDREKFYSSFIYGAVHVLVSIPQFNNIDALCEATNLTRQRMREVLDFMSRIGLIVENKGKITSGSNHVHLDNQTELILKHHTNWRLHTISNLQFLDRDDLHYSACVSLSEKDVFKIKDSILNNLKQNVEIIGASNEEVPYVLCFDFYKLLS